VVVAPPIARCKLFTQFREIGNLTADDEAYFSILSCAFQKRNVRCAVPIDNLL
jgi:hypothetical protein